MGAYLKVKQEACGEFIGPLQDHASDGDNRRRKLMLESISRGTYGLKIDEFLMCAEIVDEAYDVGPSTCRKETSKSSFVCYQSCILGKICS